MKRNRKAAVSFHVTIIVTNWSTVKSSDTLRGSPTLGALGGSRTANWQWAGAFTRSTARRLEALNRRIRPIQRNQAFGSLLRIATGLLDAVDNWKVVLSEQLRRGFPASGVDEGFWPGRLSNPCVIASVPHAVRPGKNVSRSIDDLTVLLEAVDSGDGESSCPPHSYVPTAGTNQNNRRPWFSRFTNEKSLHSSPQRPKSRAARPQLPPVSADGLGTPDPALGYSADIPESPALKKPRLW